MKIAVKSAPTKIPTKSKFRSKFRLDIADREYIERRGLPAIQTHARDFILRRLAPANVKNDGKQTPLQGHPVFKAQHATATCCRGCFYKWYGIPKTKNLTKPEIEMAVSAIMQWIELQYQALLKVTPVKSV